MKTNKQSDHKLKQKDREYLSKGERSVAYLRGKGTLRVKTDELLEVTRGHKNAKNSGR